jgi:hypothetical protein
MSDNPIHIVAVGGRRFAFGLNWGMVQGPETVEKAANVALSAEDDNCYVIVNISQFATGTKSRQQRGKLYCGVSSLMDVIATSGMSTWLAAWAVTTEDEQTVYIVAEAVNDQVPPGGDQVFTDFEAAREYFDMMRAANPYPHIFCPSDFAEAHDTTPLEELLKQARPESLKKLETTVKENSIAIAVWLREHPAYVGLAVLTLLVAITAKPVMRWGRAYFAPPAPIVETVQPVVQVAAPPPPPKRPAPSALRQPNRVYAQSCLERIHPLLDNIPENWALDTVLPAQCLPGEAWIKLRRATQTGNIIGLMQRYPENVRFEDPADVAEIFVPESPSEARPPETLLDVDDIRIRLYSASQAVTDELLIKNLGGKSDGSDVEPYVSRRFYLKTRLSPQSWGEYADQIPGVVLEKIQAGQDFTTWTLEGTFYARAP